MACASNVHTDSVQTESAHTFAGIAGSINSRCAQVSLLSDERRGVPQHPESDSLLLPCQRAYLTVNIAVDRACQDGGRSWVSPRMIHFPRHPNRIAKKSLAEREMVYIRRIPFQFPLHSNLVDEENTSGKSLKRGREDREAAAERKAARKGT